MEGVPPPTVVELVPEPREIEHELLTHQLIQTGHAISRLARKIQEAERSRRVPRRALEDLELRLQEIATKSLPPEYQSDLERVGIYMHELDKNWRYFGEYDYPPVLPEWVTPEQITAWAKQGFELHYLQAVSATERRSSRSPTEGFVHYPGFRVRPADDLIDRIYTITAKARHCPEPGRWLLIDRRDIPRLRNNRTQMYDNDPMASLLKDFRQQMSITWRPGGFGGPRHEIHPPRQGSRFGYPVSALMDENLRRIVARYLHLPENNEVLPRLPTVWEWMTLANRDYPQWLSPIDPARPDVTFEHISASQDTWAAGGVQPDGRLNLQRIHSNESKELLQQIGFRYVVEIPAIMPDDDVTGAG